MRWQNRRRSTNVDDRRGRPGGPAVVGGAGLLIVVVLALLFGADPAALLQQVGQAPPGGQQAGPVDPAQDELKEFVSVVLADTEDVWGELFRRQGKVYREPTLVLFDGRVQSACGMASAATGPFYCPADEKIYIDLSFFAELRDRFDAPGDFAQAYVIAHEIGHHVQNQLGVMDEVQNLRARMSEEEANALSVRLELQADFLAGVWAHHGERAKRFLEAGDVDEALDAASAIGDDRIQREAQGYVVPDAFTHGTSAQRKRWFRQGLETGDMAQGDTFAARQL